MERHGSVRRQRAVRWNVTWSEFHSGSYTCILAVRAVIASLRRETRRINDAGANESKMIEAVLLLMRRPTNPAQQNRAESWIIKRRGVLARDLDEYPTFTPLVGPKERAWFTVLDVRRQNLNCARIAHQVPITLVMQTQTGEPASDRLLTGQFHIELSVTKFRLSAAPCETNPF